MNTKTIYSCRVALITLVSILAGCTTSSPSQYISPRITGRVIDTKTGQPIENVQVRRRGNDERTPSPESAKGGEQMTRSSAAYTKPDGSFIIASESEVAFLRAVGWYSVTLSFEHPAYYKTAKSYTPKNSTNSPAGEPWIQAGDIPMDPLSK